ncbi:MAG: hypothetical protein JWP34_5202, partial [Massilia sp.]|nr:hypothetical protein [Massilia sp.]
RGVLARALLQITEGEPPQALPRERFRRLIDHQKEVKER